MSEMSRREALGLLALTPLAAAVQGPQQTLVQIAPKPPAAEPAPAAAWAPKFFTAQEFATVGVLANLVIPADERSGSATDAGVPEFMDFVLSEIADGAGRTAMRGGLAWLDGESRRRFEKRFVELAEAQQTAILDDIAWPRRARPEMSHGVTFFSRFRDMVASGFWSSKMGIEDLRYLGNTAVMEWNGCPPEALAKLGVSYRG